MMWWHEPAPGPLETPQFADRQARAKALRAERTLRGLCIQCGDPSQDAKRCDACRERNNVSAVKHREKRRQGGLKVWVEKRKDCGLRRLQLKLRQIERGIARAEAKRVEVVKALHLRVIQRELATYANVVQMAPKAPLTIRRRRHIIEAEREAETDAIIAELQSRGYVPRQRRTG